MISDTRDVVAWMVNAAVWLGFFWRGSALWNSALRAVIEPNRRTEFSVWFHPEAFTAQGQVLRRKAIRFWIIGGTVVLVYFWVLLPLNR